MVAGVHQIVPRRRGWVFDETPAIWFAPLGLLLAVFYLWPVLQVVRMSFTDANLMEPTARTTLDSYRDVLFYSGLNEIGKATLVFVGGSVVGQLSLGLLIALALDAGAKRKLLGVTFVRVGAAASVAA
jgi:multiple sugar transport system permease protein